MTDVCDMSSPLLTQESTYLSAFDWIERNGSGSDPLWAHTLRQAAISRFEELGFPTARRGNEEWKYTDVGPIARTHFRPVLTARPARHTVQELEQFIFSERSWSRLVFVDGIYEKELSSISSMPASVSVLNLAEAMRTKADLVQQHLARYADYKDQAFTALNTAFIHDGVFIHIPDGTFIENPIHLLFLSDTDEEDAASHPRSLVIVGKDSKATIIESYGGLSNGQYFTNAVSEVVVGPGAVVNYYRDQRHSEQAFHVGTTQVVLGRDSSFFSFTTDVGGGLVRNNLNVIMGDKGSSCILNGVYVVARSQHVDNQVIIYHEKPYTTSRELYRGVLDSKSRAVFHGSIIVRKDAQKVDARQEDKNLLLSDQAEADTKPAFWIYADDVKCSHGASCGMLDETALFYLRSRGISEDAARNLLVRGFVSEVINTISSEPFQSHVDQLVMSKLEKL